MPADPENPACISPAQPPAATNLGTAEILGNDAIVATQPFVDVGSAQHVSAIPPSSWSGLAMHELGHNLGLLHGGSDCLNNKPNYVSVMNYRFYTEGIPVSASPGATGPASCLTDADCVSPHAVGAHCSGFTHTCFRIDYSDGVLGSVDPANPGFVGLNETNLNETVGLRGGLANDTDISQRHQVRPASRYVGIPTNGSPIDWNDDGLIGTGVVFDINGDLGISPLPGQDDWATTRINGVDLFTKLKFSFQCQPTYSGVLAATKQIKADPLLARQIFSSIGRSWPHCAQDK